MKMHHTRMTIGFRTSIIGIFAGAVLVIGVALVFLSFERATSITRSAAASFLDTIAQLSADRIDAQFTAVHADGSVDIYFAPKPPAGQETKWVSAAEGRPYFLLFRNYAPEKSVLERTSSWALNDLEKIRCGARNGIPVGGHDGHTRWLQRPMRDDRRTGAYSGAA
jgi:Protein of unknown function (DUF1214)